MRKSILISIFCCLINIHLAVAAETVTLSLREGMDIVASGGRAVKIASFSQDMARSDKDMAGAVLRPQVSANVAQNYLAYQPAAVTGTGKLPTSEKSYASAGLEVYQTIYDFGKDRSNVRIAERLQTAAGHEVSRSRQQAVLDFVVAYFDLLEADRMITVAREEMVNLAAHLHDIAVFYREGVVTKNEFLEAEVKFRMARQKLVVFKNQRMTASLRLAQLAFLPAGSEVVAEDVTVPVPERLDLVSAQVRAAVSRPEIRQLDEVVKAAGFREQANRAGDYPTIFGDGGYSYTDNRYQSRDDNWHLIFGVKVNVFNGGLTKAGTLKEQQRRQQLEEQRRKLEEDIRLEVERDFRDINNAREKIMVGRSSLVSATENARVLAIQYKEGAAASTAVTDAVALRTAAETDYWRGTYELKRAWARFLYSIGQDVKETYLLQKERL
jgi:outer membrane protein